MRGTPYSSSPALGVYVVIFSPTPALSPFGCAQGKLRRMGLRGLFIFSPPIYSADFIYPPMAESINKGAYTKSIGISPELPALA